MFKKGDKVKLKGGVNQDTCFNYPDQEMKVTRVYEKTQLCDIFEETEGLTQLVDIKDIEKVEKEKTMDIKRKADGGIVRGVTESCYFETYGWVKESPDCTTYYRKDQWEPVEEWVTIQVDKHDWLNADKGCGEFVTINRLKNTRVRWRYPK